MKWNNSPMSVSFLFSMISYFDCKILLSLKVKARLGGRVRLIISGGAPLSTDVEEFLRVTCCAFVTQGYGKEQRSHET